MKPISTLRVSISGVRGVVGDTLKPLLLCRFARAFATYLGKGSIAVGRDTRRSGEMVEHAVHSGLLASGMQVINLGIAPVPTIQHAVRTLRCKGGIAITASHNPAQWNALKFIKGNGRFLSSYEAEELLSLYHQEDFTEVDASRISPPVDYSHSVQDHQKTILEKIAPPMSPRLKVVVDCCNGAGAVMTPQMLRDLNCEVIELSCTPDGNFPRPPEPVPANLTELCKAVLREGADIGFAQDADADRLAIVSNEGKAIGEEYTLALCTYYVLSRQVGPVVVNLSTSRMVDDIAAMFGTHVVRTRIGEVNVTEAIDDAGAVIGGEGNGGVIYPAVNTARDSFVGMALVLSLMRSLGKPVSELVKLFPSYEMSKTAFTIHPHRVSTLIEELTQQYQAENLNLLDGLKIIRPDGWIHVRPSNTEPITRVVVEARTGELLSSYLKEMQSRIG